ncbi:hypothetical protein Taro_026476 [Colocasia esculenta]|uniref:Aminotransferase-like plant mobile domain-containing protein n=1 Tax=Colocasia esculenta TaxID=4460 RepID=A0A843VC05_COLES|nr:hypothetical protein [Colocasia esculenta]
MEMEEEEAPVDMEGAARAREKAMKMALRSRWDVEATAFIFPWGHMIPSLEDVSWITGLRVYGHPESLGLYDVGKEVGETVDGELQRLTRGCRVVLAEEPGAEADLDLHRFLILFLGRLLFATRGDAVHCRFLPLLKDLDEQKELERVRRAAGYGGSSSRASESSQSDLEDRLAAAVRRAEETQIELAERERELRTATDHASQLQGQVDAATGERDRLRIRVEAAELLVSETTPELATLRVQGSSVDQKEMVRLRSEVTTKQIRIDELRGLVTTLGQAA